MLKLKQLFRHWRGGFTADDITDILLKRWGVSQADNAAYLLYYDYKGKAKFINDCIWWPTRRVFWDPFMNSDESFLQFNKNVLKISPRFICGYLELLLKYCDVAGKYKLPMIPGVHCIWITGDPPSNEERLKIESTFGAPAYYQFGIMSCAYIGAETVEKNGIEVFSKWRKVDINDGHIFVTDLLKVGSSSIDTGYHGRWMHDRLILEVK